MQFAHLKRILRLNRLRLRGPRGARDEFLLAATAQNLRKLAKLLIRPLPDHGAARGAVVAAHQVDGLFQNAAQGSHRVQLTGNCRAGPHLRQERRTARRPVELKRPGAVFSERRDSAQI